MLIERQHFMMFDSYSTALDPLIDVRIDVPPLNFSPVTIIFFVFFLFMLGLLLLSQNTSFPETYPISLDENRFFSRVSLSALDLPCNLKVNLFHEYFYSQFLSSDNIFIYRIFVRAIAQHEHFQI